MDMERVERRLAAILAADMVGYSRLMAEDEAGTLARLKALRTDLIDAEIEAHGGRIAKLMGDDMLVVFDSVVGAVECAAAVRKAMTKNEAGIPAGRRITFRVCINLGDVMVDGDDVYGDGVNVAARLEGIAPPGGICLTDDAYRQVKGKTDLHFQDLGERELKNIPDKVRVHIVDLDPARLSPEDFEALTGERLELPDKPSIAVLPFENMSGDPEQEFFADGMAEDIITVLSRVSNLVVMARNSTFVYKGQAVDVGQVGRDLGVRYVLEGSVRKAGDRVRITAQLVDAQSGDHVWAGRYDRKLDDIFAVQDEITREIVVALSVNLAHGEEVRIWSSSTTNFQAWEYVSRGLVAQYKFTNETNREARRLTRKAIALDSENAMAKILLGWALMVASRYGFVSDPEAAITEAESLVGEVLNKDDGHADAHALMGYIHATRRRFDEALAAGQRAIELAPNVASNHAFLALTLHFSGMHAQSLVRIRKAMRLSPYFPDWFLMLLGDGYRGTGDLEKAREVFESFAARTPDSLLSQTRLACIYSNLGKITKARQAAETVLSIDPDFSVARFVSRAPFKKTADRDRLAASLLRAGLPE